MQGLGGGNLRYVCLKETVHFINLKSCTNFTLECKWMRFHSFSNESVFLTEALKPGRPKSLFYSVRLLTGDYAMFSDLEEITELSFLLLLLLLISLPSFIFWGTVGVVG